MSEIKTITKEIDLSIFWCPNGHRQHDMSAEEAKKSKIGETLASPGL